MSRRFGALVLFAATAMVAISILLDGAGARIANGVGGLAWFLAAVLMARAAWRSSHRPVVWATALASTALVEFIVRPVDLIPTIVGFSFAAMLVAIVARQDTVVWAMTIVAFYLPFHVGTAIARTLYRIATGGPSAIRSDAPPTAALVPIVMFVTALGCGYLAQVWIERHPSSRSESAWVCELP